MTNPDTPVTFSFSGRRLYDITDDQLKIVKAFRQVLSKELKFCSMIDCAYALKESNWDVDKARVLMIELSRYRVVL
ncbi:hypothetical protein EVB32_232 [Rhizobium phage RHph_TM39]|uniref:Uncharacterized protein n=1 Tax=Rhizobium phage RHph_TM30 TaxID=2509764 RepID=A0A7S5UUP4_9CAUD|nr:hypothetical protein PQC16_gp248 [Rhizobium phage RHph_TM30]QIG71719.1 hypothetical protein EVB94_248 [Rhizobium phage RHph_TM40]QIG72082.1 hypothetical protein EVB95_248 [Rhizobium phage RHph_TM2_3B]QIG72444.1 hypothetical protein EVB96_248 [Rhizobium phage RHph_TM3_3_6]QIG77220.1 hypothetical protein EVB32_232 [Rhizobium phage RHph_TM39]QIG77834.1 hypothetical protein EVB64_247 [Rhizobium phage RHph_TM61]